MAQLTTAQKARIAEIDDCIAENKTTLKACQSHLPLKAFAEEHGMCDSAFDFGCFKRGLMRIGVDYDSLREAATAERDEQMHQRAEELTADNDLPTVLLWSAAIEDDETGRGAFAVVAEDSCVIWYGGFSRFDRTRVAGDIVSAETSAAEKCVFVASKAIEAAGEEAGRVIITTNCPDVEESHLRRYGAGYNIAVDLIVDGDDERAVTMATQPGWKKWSDPTNDLASLVEAVE